VKPIESRACCEDRHARGFFTSLPKRKDVDGRDKPGHGEGPWFAGLSWNRPDFKCLSLR
jgi:hypothetical protein